MLESNFLPPLAERMRPKTLTHYVGQSHLLGEGKPLYSALHKGNTPSMILWGSPGVGKTTLAYIIAQELQRSFYALSAINAGVKEVREVLDKARNSLQKEPTPILFIDEIHRFSKSQQDALLGAVEQGIVVLIGATTENPSFEVIAALLSRCQLYVLNSLTEEELRKILLQALANDVLLQTKNIHIEEYEALFRVSGGDARKLLNALELVVSTQSSDKCVITNAMVLAHIQQNIALYDKNGEQHYDIVSAFIKSIRGSDPNAAVYWLARMIQGGEAPLFIARRLLILAAEDIGLANPNALLLANSCFQAVQAIGLPEGRIVLSQTAIYLATSPKSNSAYQSINKAQELVQQTGNLPVPLHLRNAPTKMMKQLDYGKNYQYAHDFDNHFVEQEFLPDSIASTQLYTPCNNPNEDKQKASLHALWKNKYNY